MNDHSVRYTKSVQRLEPVPRKAGASERRTVEPSTPAPLKTRGTREARILLLHQTARSFASLASLTNQGKCWWFLFSQSVPDTRSAVRLAEIVASNDHFHCARHQAW